MITQLANSIQTLREKGSVQNLFARILLNNVPFILKSFSVLFLPPSVSMSQNTGNGSCVLLGSTQYSPLIISVCESLMSLQDKPGRYGNTPKGAFRR